MSTIYDFNKVKIMPFYALRIEWTSDRPHSSQAYVEIRNVGAESTYEFKPTRRANDLGGLTVVAYTIDINAFVLQNNYNELQKDIDNINRGEINKMHLLLRAQNGQQAGGAMTILCDKSIAHKSWSASSEIKNGDMTPQLIVRVKGVFSADLMATNSNDGLFKGMTLGGTSVNWWEPGNEYDEPDENNTA